MYMKIILAFFIISISKNAMTYAQEIEIGGVYEVRNLMGNNSIGSVKLFVPNQKGNIFMPLYSEYGIGRIFGKFDGTTLTDGKWALGTILAIELGLKPCIKLVGQSRYHGNIELTFIKLKKANKNYSRSAFYSLYTKCDIDLPDDPKFTTFREWRKLKGRKLKNYNQ